MWLVVGPEAEEPIRIVDMPGANCAATRFTGLSNVDRVWRELAAWFEDGPHTRPRTGARASRRW